MAHALNLKLWEAVRDGNLRRADAALEEGADPNLSLGVTLDASTGQRQWCVMQPTHPHTHANYSSTPVSLAARANASIRTSYKKICTCTCCFSCCCFSSMRIARGREGVGPLLP